MNAHKIATVLRAEAREIDKMVDQNLDTSAKQLQPRAQGLEQPRRAFARCRDAPDRGQDAQGGRAGRPSLALAARQGGTMIAEWKVTPTGDRETRAFDPDAAAGTFVVCGAPFLTPAHLQAAVESLPAVVEQLTEALAWYFDQLYDGPDTDLPEWVSEGVEILGGLLVPEGDLRARTEATQAHLWKVTHPTTEEPETDDQTTRVDDVPPTN